MADRRVVIRPAANQLASLRVAFDLNGDVQVTGGLGGWSELTRPRRTTAYEWTGTPGRAQVLPLLLDGMEAAPGVDASVEPQIQAVESWGTPSGVTDNQPPPLQLAGPVFTAGQWVLQSVDYGTVIRNDAGDRIQANLTLTLLQYESAQLLRSPAKRVRHAKGKPKPKGKGK